MFDHILKLGNLLRCDFSVGIRDILNNDVDGILDGVGIEIAQGSDVSHVDICDIFASIGRPQ